MIYENINTVIDGLSTDIPSERKTFLEPLVAYIQAKLDQRQPIRLNMICTHNSRRSHLSQIWAQVMGYYYGIQRLQCYSGGTESTAVFFSVLDSLKESGFKIISITEGNNPVYAVKFAANEAPVICFSKTYDADFNPSSDYAAVLTCSQVDKECPVIFGAEQRISLPYEDPKKFDNTSEQLFRYTERSHQIASEMKYAFSQLKP